MFSRTILLSKRSTRVTMRLLNDAPGDAVTELLATLKVSSSVYCLSDLGAPWGFAVDGENVAKFHLVLEGACWLQAAAIDPVRLGAGAGAMFALAPREQRRLAGAETHGAGQRSLPSARGLASQVRH